ncbi:MAG: sigma-70 family RNA polymerase sigma factor, partial [Muribaculaceae bacterium]|nr:sigma-70 family RNA polymerase sigma factor [Muribaculaceae bacterium]
MTKINDIEMLFRVNYEAMYLLASRLLRDEDAAKDIVHDVFSGILSSGNGNVSAAYLLKAVRNLCVNRLRNLSTRQRIQNLYAMDLKEIEEGDWPDEETIAHMREIIDTLTEKSRLVFEMRFCEDKSYREISEALDISEVSVYKHLRHAL